MTRGGGAYWIWVLAGPLAALALAQPVPQPFPRPGEAPRTPAPEKSAPPQKPPAPQQPATPAVPAPPAASSAVPNEATLGVPVYPGAQFLVSFNAGKGQRYYLFGTNATFSEIVAYYRTVLKQRGELVFDAPATHMFDLARFRDETMAFPPSVTVKDYTWNGSPGYLNPIRGKGPERFKTIIQIVPPPPPAPR